MQKLITVENLKKSYKNNEVLKGITFSVEQGEIFSLLGINGAGKTTTLECMEGLRSYDAGKIVINGKIGVQLQSSSLPSDIQAIEAVRLFSKWNHCNVDMDYLQRLGVSQIKHKQYKAMSTGQKRRLHLALAMIGNPDIIFLDEPTAGLDVEGRIALHEEIRKIKKLGKTIIMASHDMAEIEELSDKIAILRDGVIAFRGTSKELTQHIGENQLLHIRFSAPLEINKYKNCVYKEKIHDYLLFETNNLTECLQELSSLAMQQGCHIKDLQIEHASLEERFISIAKEGKE